MLTIATGLEEDTTVQGITGGVLTFVLIGALAAIFWLEFRDGKRSSKKKKEKPESTVI